MTINDTVYYRQMGPITRWVTCLIRNQNPESCPLQRQQSFSKHKSSPI